MVRQRASEGTQSPATGSSGPEAASEVVVDVWSRTSPRYRTRAVALLAVNVLLFGCVGNFAFWLRSGTFFAPATEGYWRELAQTFRFGQNTVVTLAQFLLEPISAEQVPMQIPIVGLLMAALIAIPILISILYRFWSSLPFIAVVGFLAVMPWLAITLLGSCIIASVRPFRSRFRFMSALLGLVPTVVYLILAWHGSAEIVSGRINPVDRIKFIAPWALAVVAAALLFALVLTIAKIVNYRPGAVTPLLALMFGLPVALFEFHVGRDELHYRLLEELSKAHFVDANATLDLRQAVQRRWERHPLPRPRWGELYEIEEQKWLFELGADLGPYETDLTRHQAELTERCDWFHQCFPDSRYVLNALFIKARALDTRVDPGEFRRTKWIRFYDNFPSQASRETWQIIAANGGGSAVGIVAQVRLAQLDARAGRIDRAIDGLDRLLSTSDRNGEVRDVPTQEGADSFGGLLARSSPDASLHIETGRVLLEAQWLLALLRENRDPVYGYDPFIRPRHRAATVQFGLLDLDPRHERYIDNLKTLKDAYPKCQLEDNLDLEIAKATTSIPLKIERLEDCLREYPHRDSTSEALFRLAVVYKAAGRSSESREMFARLVTEHRDSVWSRQATRHLGEGSPVRVTDAGT